MTPGNTQGGWLKDLDRILGYQAEIINNDPTVVYLYVKVKESLALHLLRDELVFNDRDLAHIKHSKLYDFTNKIGMGCRGPPSFLSPSFFYVLC